MKEIKKETRQNKFNYKIILFAFLFLLCLTMSYYFFTKAINIENSRIVNYKEDGTIDYKVYLKENTFYETEYLNKDMYYIASLIDNVKIDMNYNFHIDENVNTSFTYDVVGVLSIIDSEGKKKLFEKKYILKEPKTVKSKKVKDELKKQTIDIDYDYYNDIANRFKSTYGVDADANLIVYLNINKLVENDTKSLTLGEKKAMSIEIPLSQKTLEIMMHENGIANSSNYLTKTNVAVGNLIYIVLIAIFFIAMVASLLYLLELIFAMIPKKTKYDKYIAKLLKEYDRLIVESPTKPNFEGLEKIEIMKFPELLDVRDNLKKPIMFYNLKNHEKSYFYIESENKVYLLKLNSIDFKEDNEKTSV